ncbi:MAG: acyl-CoA dehydratase activase-related protein [Eubacteriales bacterium]|nr:acyl-CoA dehydratase activase-related protein [Eubacteriales bacterium]
MKITFPHIGDAHLIGRIFFTEIGIDVVTPPPNSIRVLEKGSEVSPEEICIPFKLMVSNLMEAYRLGADTVIMPATMGPCRLGEYGELLRSILDKRGYPFHWILLDSPTDIGKRELLRRLSSVVSDSGKPTRTIIRALYRTYRILKNLELLDQRAHILAGYEIQKGSCKGELAACRRKLANTNDIRTALRIVRDHQGRLEKIPMDFNRHPLHLLITGEIFSMIEPFANHHIGELLMDMGVSFERRVTLGWWINRTIIDPFQLKELFARKNRYLPYAIGGYAKETVEEGIQCSRKGYDGLIQVFPVGCMPEIVAKAVFSKMMKEKKLSILTVIYDEMGGEAGYITRVEAFIDMLERKKRIEVSKEGRSARAASAEGNQEFPSGSGAATARGKANVLSGH